MGILDDYFLPFIFLHKRFGLVIAKRGILDSLLYVLLKV